MIETLPTTTEALDLVGDVHGEINELTGLLDLLGYVREDARWSGPAGRRLVFVGDLIDRGPGIRKTVRLVRELHEQGLAHVCIGNHEYNALCCATPAPEGGFLRSEAKAKRAGHLSTLRAFQDAPEEWASHLAWFASLPLAIEIPGRLRIVHACWDAPSIARAAQLPPLCRKTLLEIERGPELKRVQQQLLCGPEMELPGGHQITDLHGNVRSLVRYRWYRSPEPGPLHEIAFPPLPSDDGTALDPLLAGMGSGYASEAVPVVVGHYAVHGAPAPLAPNVACIDYGAAKRGRLTAYRWDGEARFSADKFIQSPQSTPAHS